MRLAAGYAGLVGLGAARLVARRALSDLESVRTALARVGEGARDVRVSVGAGDELAALAADVEKMAARIDAEERTRRRLVASVSHDLRTPITNLRLITEGLEDGIFEPARSRELMRSISSQVRALGVLIDDLFELSRLEAGDINWSMQQVHLDDLVRETIETMRPQAEESRISMRSELARELSPARGNPEQLQRVLFNLIQNAIRHTPADGSVVVRAWPAEERAVEVEVADTGRRHRPGRRQATLRALRAGSLTTEGQDRLGGPRPGHRARHRRSPWRADLGRAHAGPGTQIRFSLPVAV